MSASVTTMLSHAWEVLVLFVIPIGGGIPAGVVVAQKYGLPWPFMMLLYFISDVLLAIVFEPLMLLFLRASARSERWGRVRAGLAKSVSHIRTQYGVNPGPFALVVITFGTDPMTGRSIAKAAGHGFFSGWTIAIIGDMFFFAVLMVSTIWLNNLIGDGTVAALIVMVAMLALPGIVRRIRRRFWAV